MRRVEIHFVGYTAGEALSSTHLSEAMEELLSDKGIQPSWSRVELTPIKEDS